MESKVTTPQYKLKHICEVCGKEEILTPEEAFDAGWDYPPKMGSFGVLSPRTCPNCVILDTAWFALVASHIPYEQLTDRQKAAVERIKTEPECLLVKEE